MKTPDARNNAFSKLRAGVIGAGLLLLMPFAVNAQMEEIAEFDCRDTIRQMVEPRSGASMQGRARGRHLYLIPREQGTSIEPDTDDFVNMDENVGRVLAGGWSSDAEDVYVGCALFAASFPIQTSPGVRETRGISAQLDEEPQQNLPDVLPVLMLREFNSESLHREAFELWEDANYSVVLLVENIPTSPYYHNVYEEDAVIPITHELIASTEYFGNSFGNGRRPTEDQFRVHGLDRNYAETQLRQLFGLDDNRGLINEVLVLCAPLGCDEMLGMHHGAIISLSEVRIEAAETASIQQPDFQRTQVEGADTRSVLQATPEQTTDEITSTEFSSTDTNPGLPTPEQGVAIGTGIDVEGAYDVVVQIETQSGERRPLVADSNPLPCILFYMGAQIDLGNVIACNDPRFRDFENSEIEVLDDGTWLLRQRQVQRPVLLRVALPAAVDGNSCAMNAVFSASEGGIVPLEEVVTPSVFEARIPEDVVISPNQQFEVLIEVLNPSACGAPSRSVIIEAGSEVIDIPLSEVEQRLDLIAHIFLLSRADLAEVFSLRDTEADSLGDAVLGAIGAAHGNLAQSERIDIAPFTDTAIGAIDSQSNLQLSLISRDRLLDFTISDTVFEIGREAARTQTAVDSSVAMRNIFGRLVDMAAQTGAGGLRVNFIGLVHTQARERFSSVCAPDFVADALTELNSSLPVDVALYPLVPLEPGGPDFMATELTALRPLARSIGATTFPAGLTACSDTSSGVNVYPFFFETWRAPRELPIRFGSALSDHLTEGLLQDAESLEFVP